MLGGAIVGSTPAGAATAAAPSGSYSAPSPQNYGTPITLYVSSNRTQLQDIAGYISMPCTGGGSVGAAFTMAAVPLAANGSFSKTTTQRTVYAGSPATYTYTFSGTLHRRPRTAQPAAAGGFRETLVYTDSTTRSCTSNLMPWTATRDAQPAQTTAKPPVGSSSAPSPQNSGTPITFYVSSNRTQLRTSPATSRCRAPVAVPSERRSRWRRSRSPPTDPSRRRPPSTR